MLVLDEADEMLSMGFERELNAILETLPKKRQRLLFSAPRCRRTSSASPRPSCATPELITLSGDHVGALEIEHFVYMVQAGDKIGRARAHPRGRETPRAPSSSATRATRPSASRRALEPQGFDADWLNGDLPQSDRERVMSATREGRLRFLVATDVAARGIDISHLTHVINYDFPEDAEQYVHRTGRTGRAGRTGTAISLVGPKDIGNLYLLRLTYKIRPIEKQLPTAGELKTRAEADLVAMFVEAFAPRGRAPGRSRARAAAAHARAVASGSSRGSCAITSARGPTRSARRRRGEARRAAPRPQARAQPAPKARCPRRGAAGRGTERGAEGRGPRLRRPRRGAKLAAPEAARRGRAAERSVPKDAGRGAAPNRGARGRGTEGRGARGRGRAAPDARRATA